MSIRDNRFPAGLSAGFPAELRTETGSGPGSDESALVAEQRRRAVRAIASAAGDADDCALLLDALGLRPSEGVTRVPSPRPGE
jgi:hypothetical protein